CETKLRLGETGPKNPSHQVVDTLLLAQETVAVIAKRIHTEVDRPASSETPLRDKAGDEWTKKLGQVWLRQSSAACVVGAGITVGDQHAAPIDELPHGMRLGLKERG